MEMSAVYDIGWSYQAPGFKIARVLNYDDLRDEQLITLIANGEKYALDGLL